MTQLNLSQNQMKMKKISKRMQIYKGVVNPKHSLQAICLNSFNFSPNNFYTTLIGLVSNSPLQVFSHLIPPPSRPNPKLSLGN